MAKRRQNGEGTIYQRPNGLWVCEITLGYDKDNKRQKKTVSSMNLDKLKKKINDLKYLNDRKMLDAPDNIKLSEWLNFWLETYKKGQVKPTTYDAYTGAIDRYLKPLLGDTLIVKLTPIAVQKFVNELGNKGMSTAYIKKIMLVLSQAYDKAIELDKLYKNPCSNITIPKKEERKAVAFSPDEQQRFLTYCTNAESTYHNMFIFAFNTGMRLGEIQALTWDDYDAKAGTISVTKTLVTVSNRDENAPKKQTTLLEPTPKTKSGIRKIPLNISATQAIKNQQEHNNIDSPFIFYSAVGTPVQKRNIYRSFNDIVKSAGITSDVTFHSMRHSFATRLIEKGADIKTISELLGHKSIKVTLDIYSHISNDMKLKAVELLN